MRLKNRGYFAFQPQGIFGLSQYEDRKTMKTYKLPEAILLKFLISAAVCFLWYNVMFTQKQEYVT